MVQWFYVKNPTYLLQHSWHAVQICVLHHIHWIAGSSSWPSFLHNVSIHFVRLNTDYIIWDYRVELQNAELGKQMWQRIISVLMCHCLDALSLPGAPCCFKQWSFQNIKDFFCVLYVKVPFKPSTDITEVTRSPSSVKRKLRRNSRQSCSPVNSEKPPPNGLSLKKSSNTAGSWSRPVRQYA